MEGLVLWYTLGALGAFGILSVLSDRGISFDGKFDDLTETEQSDRCSGILGASIIWPLTIIVLTFIYATEWVLDNVFNKER